MLTANRESYTPVDKLPPDHDFFAYQMRVNHDIGAVASHNITALHINKMGQDYRAESQPNPVPGLQDRHCDNTQIARCVRELAFV